MTEQPIKIVMRVLSTGLISMMIMSCTTVRGPERGDSPLYVPKTPVLTNVDGKQAASGSLFNPQGANYLYSDKLATQIGDLITIRLREQTNATKKADTEIKKDNTTEIANPTILGKAMAFNSGGYDLSASADASRQFKAEADTAQSNLLTGTITVTVNEVLPNGNLIVSGEKWITLNQGDEYIRISGIIRGDDISGTNEIDSAKLANAKITYSGKGDVAETNVMGWLARFFNSGFWVF
jgi:flagellar L-ring protein FlgH